MRYENGINEAAGASCQTRYAGSADMDVTPRPKPSKSIQDKAWKNHVQSQPCLFCGRTPAGEAHHVRFGHKAGMGTKPDDYRTIPLCHKCHDDVHNYRIPSHIGREEILECMLDLLTKEVIRYRKSERTNP